MGESHPVTMSRATIHNVKSRLISTRVDYQATDSYVLRMAEEDWDPDLDFPGLDSSAVITDVGVDQFVLCKQVRLCVPYLPHSGYEKRGVS